MTPLLGLAIILYCVNAVLFGALAYFYGRTALSTRARYPLGLFVFALLLLIHSVGTAGAYLFLGPYFGEEAVPFMSVMGGIELVGVSALLRITL
ncbi:MAG TPA: hypothetical protein VEC92_03325 [Nitrososphaerales archaeon]|nr:hypothetical protein [Nitrososphaerales archaeon]